MIMRKETHSSLQIMLCFVHLQYANHSAGDVLELIKYHFLATHNVLALILSIENKRQMTEEDSQREDRQIDR